MKYYLLLLSLFVVFAGAPAACSSTDDSGQARANPFAPRDKEKPADKPAAKKVTKSGVIHPDLPEFQFDLVYAGQSDLLERIEIYQRPGAGQEREMVQGLGVSKPAPAASLDFVIEDMDFDGYQDLRLLISETGELNGDKYKYWLFRPGQAEFVPAPELEALCHLSFDQQAKEIGSTCGAKVAELKFEGYAYVDGQLVKVREARVEPFSNPDFFVRVVKGPEDKFPAFYEVVDPDGKTICRTDRAPLLCDPRQVVALFTLAEENLQASEMERYYADPVIWRGAKKSRAGLVKGHAQYQRDIVSYDLDANNLTVAYNPDQTQAMVTETVDGFLEDRHDSIIEFAVEKRYRLVKIADEWKIECEEVYKYHNLETEPVFNQCVIEEGPQPPQ